MGNNSKNIVKKWSLNFVSGAFAIALAMLYVLVLRSIAVQLEPPPGPVKEPYPDVNTEEKCAAAGGRWVARAEGQERLEREVKPAPLAQEARAVCQGPLKFERERNIRNEASRQMSLFVFALGGALVVALSLLVKQLQPVAPGLMIGGIVSFFVAGVHIWTLAPGIGKLITIVIIFIALMGIGIYVFREKKDEIASIG